MPNANTFFFSFSIVKSCFNNLFVTVKEYNGTMLNDACGILLYRATYTMRQAIHLFFILLQLACSD